MKLFGHILLGSAFVYAYMYAFGGAFFYEKIGSKKFNSIASSISLQGQQNIFDNAFATSINNIMRGKDTNEYEVMPAYILDDEVIAIKVNDSYAGMHFPNEPRIDIPIFRNAYVFLAVFLTPFLSLLF